MYKVPILALFIVILLPISSSSADSYIDELDQFENWAELHGISIVGTSKNSYDLYYSGFDKETDSVDWKKIPNVMIAANALYTIPENVIKVMDGKTIYFSTEKGRSYTVLGSFPEHGILEGLNRGIILEQNIRSHTVIHEVGHIVDYHGIKGIYNDEQNIFSNSIDERNLTFNGMDNYQSNSTIPLDEYISRYSAVNDAENFAENFAHYVIYPNEFRERMETDKLLVEEYEFLRENIFTGIEFQ